MGVAATRLMTPGRAVWGGIVGPLGFLGASFLLAVLRPELIQRQGWASWPSVMATGGAPGLPMIGVFLWLAGCYVVFSLFGLRSLLASRAAWMGFLGVAVGDALLAFPTDEAGTTRTSWHGYLHVAGILVATIATVVALGGVTVATRADPRWKVWRWIGFPTVLVAVGIGAVFGLEEGWAKIVYVLGITLPVPLMASLLRPTSAVAHAPPDPDPPGSAAPTSGLDASRSTDD